MKCKRCDKEFTECRPPVKQDGTLADGVIDEIPCFQFCSACNAVVSSVVWRHKSAYFIGLPAVAE